MDQDDPEKRIADLERELWEAKNAAGQGQFGVPGPAAPPNPAWMAPPSQWGYQQPAPTFPYMGAARRGRRLWPWFLLAAVIAAVIVVVPIVVMVVSVPWGELLGSDMPKGGHQTLLDTGVKTTMKCNDGHLTIDGDSNTMTITGHCASLTVAGQQNHITVDASDTIDVNGINNVIIYHSGAPLTANTGTGNSVQQG
jgi:DUF3060 family protein